MMKREKLNGIIENFSKKAVVDIIMGCKVCVAIIFALFTVAFFMNMIPEAYDSNLLAKIGLSVAGGFLATIITFPIYFVGIMFMGLAFRFCSDGSCCLCKAVKKMLSA